MEVNLISHTNNPKEVIYSAARQCYSEFSAWQVYNTKEEFSGAQIKKFIRRLIERGHLSPLEHVSFTFCIEGISRACSHQLVRHRIASYSQQSQRYVNMDNFRYIIPPVIRKNKEAEKLFLKVIEYTKDKYAEIRALLEKDESLDKEALNQDIRFILPNAAETKIVVSMNSRELLHFFSERLCLRAQWEIRGVARKMVALCKGVLPEVFFVAGPKCKRLGYCPENNSKCAFYPHPDKPELKSEKITN